MRDLKVTVGACGFCVDDAFWDTLTVEMSEEVDVMEVLTVTQSAS